MKDRPAVPHAGAGHIRPSVLLVDDDAGILRSVSRVLAPDFDIVAAVTDGRTAVDTARGLQPDLVVLDISMPGLNGFQTAQELTRVGSGAKVVFLTMHDEDAFVTEAIRCGAHGYVLKPQTWSDLPIALSHALEGRQVLPTLRPLVNTDGRVHSVRLHANNNAWLDEAAGMLSDALERGDTVAVALTASNREAVALRMTARGWDVITLERRGRYLAFDAAESLAQIMRDGQPESDVIADMVDGLERARVASALSSHARLTLLGEIAVPLCECGNLDAVVQLERLWNDLTRPLPFLTICAYPIGCFGDVTREPGPFHDVCTRHAVISHAPRA